MSEIRISSAHPMTVEELRDEMLEWFETVTQNQEVILTNQEEIIEKLDNLSRPGSDYSIDEG